MQHISVLGKLYETDTTDPENPLSTPLEGWHVNTVEPVKEWVDFLVKPTQPREMFLNLTTFCYKFDSEQEYLQQYAAVFGETETDQEV
jgi:hypothetical protein